MKILDSAEKRLSLICEQQFEKNHSKFSGFEINLGKNSSFFVNSEPDKGPMS